MHITADDLIAVLRSEDLRITDGRRLVCEVIAKRHAEHLTAAGIYDIVQSDTHGDLDRATVYRTLDALESAGAIKHGHIGHGPTVYHLAEDADHQHLVCSKCGRTVAVDRSDIEGFLTAIEKNTGFVPTIEHFALSGLCEDCARQSG